MHIRAIFRLLPRWNSGMEFKQPCYSTDLTFLARACHSLPQAYLQRVNTPSQKILKRFAYGGFEIPPQSEIPPLSKIPPPKRPQTPRTAPMKTWPATRAYFLRYMVGIRPKKRRMHWDRKIARKLQAEVCCLFCHQKVHSNAT
jgi:hypothetical protein